MNIKTNTMNNKVIDWEITGSLTNNKYNLNITYADGKRQTVTDTLSKLITIKDKFV